MYITGIIHSLHTYTRHNSTYVHDLPLVPLVPLVYLLGTLLAVSGSVHLCSLLLVNWPPFVLPVAHVLPLPKIPTPRGFPDPNIHSIRMTLWTRSRRSRTPRLFLIMGFWVFNKGKPSRYKVFVRWNFHFVKSKASVAISEPKISLWKVQLLGSCSTMKT